MVPIDEESSLPEPRGEAPAGGAPAGGATAGGATAPSGGLGRLLRLCRKELREVLRDRRTIITLIGMPLLVYPLLSLTFQKFLLTAGSSAEGPAYVECFAGFESQREASLLQAFLLHADAQRQRLGGPNGPVPLVPPGQNAALDEGGPEPGGAVAESELTVKFVIVEDLQRALEEGRIDVGVRRVELDDGQQLPGFPQRLRCELLYRQESPLSRRTLEFMERRLREVNQVYVAAVLRRTGLPAVYPAEVTSRAVGKPGPAVSLTTVIPLILVLMTITGAVYPAIDVTAGERERGTLEALMAAPVPRLSLLAAKYVAVLLVAVLTATANLAAMTVTLLVTPWGRLLFDAGGISAVVVAEVFLLLILFAAFFAAILLAVTSFARSFKEAQAYLIPLMLLALAPGIMSLMPGIEFNGVLAVTPLVNMVLLARDLLEGEAHAGLAAIAVLSTVFYAVAGIGLAARVFGTDALLSGSRFGWRDLLRHEGPPRQAAGIPGALACLAVLFPCYYLLSNLLILLPLDQRQKLWAAAGVTMLLFGGVPWLAARLQRVQLVSAFRLRPGPWLAYPGAALLGLTLWPLAEELFLLNRWLGLTTLDADKLRQVEVLLEQWRSIPPWLILATMAVTPAVFEELFFRGYLFSALRASIRPRTAIWASAILFGLFHVVTGSVLAVERFLPSAMLGLALGWVGWRCASIWPGILLHACHNGLLLLIAYYRDSLEAWGFGDAEQWHVPWHWLALAASGIAIGGTIVWLATRSTVRRSEDGTSAVGNAEDASSGDARSTEARADRGGGHQGPVRE